MVALWGVPAVAVILAGAPARLVSEKLAGVETPATDAVTLYGPPAVPLAVKIAAIATPCALVVAVFTPPASVPLAPLVGAVKVTVPPLTGLLKGSFTVACSCVTNAVLTVALCGDFYRSDERSERHVCRRSEHRNDQRARCGDSSNLHSQRHCRRPVSRDRVSNGGWHFRPPLAVHPPPPARHRHRPPPQRRCCAR